MYNPVLSVIVNIRQTPNQPPSAINLTYQSIDVCFSIFISKPFLSELKQGELEGLPGLGGEEEDSVLELPGAGSVSATRSDERRVMMYKRKRRPDQVLIRL